MAGINIDELLKKRNLKFEELDADEQETLNTWLGAFNNSQISINDIRNYIGKMRESVSRSLTEIDETPNDWLTILCFLIPLLGIVRKWYLDQKRVMLTARLRNYILLEAFLLSPEKAKQAIEKAISGMTAGKTRI